MLFARTNGDQSHRPQATPDQNPAQRFGTDASNRWRASRVTRMFMKVVAFVERLNLTCSKVGNPPIYDNAVFPGPKTSRANGAPSAPSSTAC